MENPNRDLGRLMAAAQGGDEGSREQLLRTGSALGCFVMG